MQSLIATFAQMRHNVTQRRFAFFVVVVVVFGIGFVPSFGYAGITDWVVTGIGWVVSFLVQSLYLPLMSWIMTMLMGLLTSVSVYNSFGDATAVQVGWVLMRDLSNMLLVVILLSMAFGTMLGQGNKLGDYKSLPKFAIIAVVINFSKMITLLMIDVSQVVMLSFSSAFQNTAAGNFLRAFGIKDWFQAKNGIEASQMASVIIAQVLAALLITITTVVILVFLVYLILRIVMLWILIIFSPLAFALNLLPSKGKEYYGKWWEHLTSTLITGPLLAFFLWLTLVVAGVSGGGLGSEVLADAVAMQAAHNAEIQNSSGLSATAGQTGLTPDVLITLILTSVMLVLGLKISIQMGGVVGGAAGAFSKPNNLMRWGKQGLKMGMKTAKFAGKARIPGRASINEVIGAKVDDVKKSKLGKFVGFDKETNERKQKVRMARYYNGRGDEQSLIKARKLENEIVAGDRKQLSGLREDQLLSKFQQAEEGSFEHKAAALELGQLGYFKTRPASIKAAAAGDADLMNELIKMTGTKEAELAKLSPAEIDTTIKNTMASQTIAQKRSDTGKLSQGFQLVVGIDGKTSMRDLGAMTRAGQIDEEMFRGRGSTDGYRKSVIEGMLLAIKNLGKDGKDSSERKMLEKKLEDLTGQKYVFDGEGNLGAVTGSAFSDDRGKSVAVSFDDAEEMQSKAYNSQQLGVTKAQTKEVRSASGVVSDGYSAVVDRVRTMDEGDRGTVRETIVPALQNTRHDLDAEIRANEAALRANPTGAIPNPNAWQNAATELDSQLAALRAVFDAQTGDTNQFDPRTNAQRTWREVFDNEEIATVLEELRNVLRERDAISPEIMPAGPARVVAQRRAGGLDERIGELGKKLDAMSQDLVTGRDSNVRSTIGRLFKERDLSQLNVRLTLGTSGARGSLQDTLRKVKGEQGTMTKKMTDAESATSGVKRRRHIKAARNAAMNTAGALVGHSQVPNRIEQEIRRVRAQISGFNVRTGTPAALRVLVDRLDALVKSLR